MNQHVITIGQVQKALRTEIDQQWRPATQTGAISRNTEERLCDIFPTCEGCPVQLFTGLDRCAGTPYLEYIHTVTFNDPIKKRIYAAVAMLVTLECVYEYYFDNTDSPLLTPESTHN